MLCCLSVVAVCCVVYLLLLFVVFRGVVHIQSPPVNITRLGHVLNVNQGNSQHQSVLRNVNPASLLLTNKINIMVSHEDGGGGGNMEGGWGRDMKGECWETMVGE